MKGGGSVGCMYRWRAVPEDSMAYTVQLAGPRCWGDSSVPLGAPHQDHFRQIIDGGFEAVLLSLTGRSQAQTPILLLSPTDQLWYIVILVRMDQGTSVYPISCVRAFAAGPVAVMHFWRCASAQQGQPFSPCDPGPALQGDSCHSSSGVAASHMAN